MFNPHGDNPRRWLKRSRFTKDYGDRLFRFGTRCRRIVSGVPHQKSIVDGPCRSGLVGRSTAVRLQRRAKVTHEQTSSRACATRCALRRFQVAGRPSGCRKSMFSMATRRARCAGGSAVLAARRARTIERCHAIRQRVRPHAGRCILNQGSARQICRDKRSNCRALFAGFSCRSDRQDGLQYISSVHGCPLHEPGPGCLPNP